MKFDKTLGGYHADTVLRATPDDVFDGVPTIGELLVESNFRNVSADAQAVAGVLLFGKYVGHDIGSDKGVSRLTAEAITDYFPNRKVFVRNLTDQPVAAWPSAGELAIRRGNLENLQLRRDGIYSHTLTLLDSNIFSGAIASTTQSFIATTAQVFSVVNETPFWKAALAVGILAAADLHVRTIVLPHDEFGEIEASSEERLLRSIDLNLIVG